MPIDLKLIIIQYLIRYSLPFSHFQQAELEKTMATCLEQLDCEKKKVSKLEEEMKFKVRNDVICNL